MTALPAAIAFAIALNLLLAARFLYPEMLAPGAVRFACWAGIGIWGYLAMREANRLPGLIRPRALASGPDRFPEAHAAYLHGQWAQAEAALADCLAIESRDPPALLLLAGVYRHTQRWDAAQRLLSEIRLTEAADRWWLEVDAEEKRLLRDRERLAPTAPTASLTPPPIPEADEDAGGVSAPATPSEPDSDRARFDPHEAIGRDAPMAA
jgi:hypothetical protein